MKTSTRGTGWLTFAGIVLIFAGVMRFFDGIWAFRYNGSLPDALQDATFGDDLTTYGWIYVLVGLILVLAGFGVLYRSQFSRWIGIIAAAIGGLERDGVAALLPDLVAHLHHHRGRRDHGALRIRRA